MKDLMLVPDVESSESMGIVMFVVRKVIELGMALGRFVRLSALSEYTMHSWIIALGFGPDALEIIPEQTSSKCRE